MIAAIETKIVQYYKKYIIAKKVEKGLFYTGGRDNIGDSMVPWLINKISGVDILYSNPREATGPHLFTIGSILQYADKDSHIWGSGFISKNSKLHSKPAEVYAVRGPLTAQRLKDLVNVDCNVFCDPALLTARFIKPDSNLNLKKIGLIPHYVDKEKLSKTKIINHDSVKVCDVETADIQKFINEICSCEVIISSSLHGIILAEAFGIPAVWAKFGKDVYGDDFKFYDYYLSTGRSNIAPACFYTITEDNLLNKKTLSHNTLTSMGDSLLECYPNVFK
jgi:pyruvyltransferase